MNDDMPPFPGRIFLITRLSDEDRARFRNHGPRDFRYSIRDSFHDEATKAWRWAIIPMDHAETIEDARSRIPRDYEQVPGGKRLESSDSEIWIPRRRNSRT